MKAYEAKKETRQEYYQKIMKRIQGAIKDGRQNTGVNRYGSENYSLFLKDPEEVIERLLEEGYDIILYYNGDDLISINVSWENAKEGRKGSRTINKKEKAPEPKPGFWKRLCDFLDPEGEDGMCC